jgi:solute carrier family 25 carnitine/acylcarnitine transporter 20/29
MQYEEPASSFASTSTPNPSEPGEKEVTAAHDLIAGGIAGSASVIVGHPFDTIKVRMQTSSASTSASFGGGFLNLFRGMAAPLSTAAVVNAIIFAAYGTSSRWWDQYMPPPDSESLSLHHDPTIKSFCCGSFAGFCQALVICPMEHLKCRLQLQPGSPGHVAYDGPIGAARAIVKSHGVPGLYRGFVSTLWREVPAFGAYFSVYDIVKDGVNDYFDTHNSSSEQHTWIASAFAGGFSGSFTWAIIYPIDVIKTRIQTAPLDATSNLGMLSVGRSIIANHGWRYMFRGLGIALFRAFPVNGIIFPVYEFTLTHLTNLD